MSKISDTQEINHIRELLKRRSIKISARVIKEKLNQIGQAQDVFGYPQQRALLVQLLDNYENTHKKQVIILKELERSRMPAYFVLGILAEDWPGMSNSILGIVHHQGRNVLFVKGITMEYDNKPIGLVILSFKIDNKDEYEQFLLDKRDLLARIKEASRGSTGKFLLLDDEAVKFEIYNNLTNTIGRMYHSNNLVKIIEESGEALKFVSSRSREYLEERETKDLAKLIVDNYSFQLLIRSGITNEIVQVKNIQTSKEKLTGLSVVCNAAMYTIEDFLKVLDYIVPDHITKHHKSFVTMDRILVYRIEIVDRYGKPLSHEQVKYLEQSIKKLMAISCSQEFSKLKSIGGIEHYARAIIPFLMDELARTRLAQAFFNVDKKTDFIISIKLIIVSFKTRSSKQYDLIYKISLIKGIDVISTIPSKTYLKNDDTVHVDMLRLKVNLAEFSSLKEIYSTLKAKIKRLYGDIRDFDEGFREIYIRRLNRLLDDLDHVNPTLVSDIFFSMDEIYRVEVPEELQKVLIDLCSQVVEEARDECCDKLVVKYRNLESQDRTILVVSYEEQLKLLSRLIRKLKGITLYFSKIEWNQRYYVLMILSRNKKMLAEDVLKNLVESIENLVKS